MKNSSRFEVKIARNLALSSSGVRSSSASASTRSLKSSQLRSRSIQTSDSDGDNSLLRMPSSPIETMALAAHILVLRQPFSADRDPLHHAIEAPGINFANITAA